MLDEDKKYETEFQNTDGSVTGNQTDTDNRVEENISNTDSAASGGSNFNNTSSFLADDSNARKDDSNERKDYNSSPYRDYNDYNNYNSYNGDYYNSSNKKNKKGGKGSVILALVMAFMGVALIGVVAFATMNMNGNNAKKSGDEVAKSIINGEGDDNSEYPSIASTDSDKKESDKKDSKEKAQPSSGVVITDVSNIVEDVMPSIVAITSQRKVEEYENFGDFDDLYRYFYGYDYEEPDDQDGRGGSDSDNDEEYEDTGAGSGIIVKQTDSELLIVTNNHVVEGADALSILFNDGKFVKGQIKSTDSTADIAIVSIPLKDIEKETLSSIRIAELGDSDALNVGEGVVAIGNALGYGQSVTTGVISAKNRVIAVEDKQMTVLQTDAAINGGNSGGALINSAGEVIGINVAKFSSGYSSTSIEGMGFAIPISQALDTIDNLVSKEKRDVVNEAERGSLGIKGSTVTNEGNQVYGIPFGVYIDEVTPGGAAEEIGLQKRDVILKFDGYSITTIAELKDKLKYYKAGEKVELTISRLDGYEYKEQTVSVTLGKVK